MPACSYTHSATPFAFQLNLPIVLFSQQTYICVPEWFKRQTLKHQFLLLGPRSLSVLLLFWLWGLHSHSLFSFHLRFHLIDILCWWLHWATSLLFCHHSFLELNLLLLLFYVLILLLFLIFLWFSDLLRLPWHLQVYQLLELLYHTSSIFHPYPSKCLRWWCPFLLQLFLLISAKLFGFVVYWYSSTFAVLL